jgi:hypothetical protein
LVVGKKEPKGLLGGMQVRLLHESDLHIATELLRQLGYDISLSELLGLIACWRPEPILQPLLITAGTFSD